jgi:NAD dependent epimerase/dehydratase family enzyme
MSQRATIPAKQARMKVAITGASGLLGRALAKALKERGDEPVAAKRSGAADGALKWDVKRGFDPPDALSGFDAVVHLAGENVGDGRWTDARKQEILDSRVDGTQPMPWVHIDDVVASFLWLLDRDDASGIYNVAAPNPIDNATFTRALGKALHRPTFMPVPTFALRVMFGEMADVVLHGQRAVPRRLLNDGFAFTFTDLDVALRNLVA